MPDRQSVDWPDSFEETPPADRTEKNSYRVTLHEAVRDLADEMDMLGVDDWRLETNLDHRKDKPNMPYANQTQATDAAVVLRWTMDEAQYAVACDRYTPVRDNVRTIGLYIREKRKMQNRPVVTGESEFANAALPPGDESGETTLQKPAHEVLGVAPDAPETVVEAAARQLKAEHHPDKGDGDRERFIRINKAEKRMLGAGGTA